MSDSYGKYLEDLQDYAALCKLLNEEKLPPSGDWFYHFITLKADDRVEFKDYKYQLKS
jgi:hypothetical protein